MGHRGSKCLSTFQDKLEEKGGTLLELLSGNKERKRTTATETGFWVSFFFSSCKLLGILSYKGFVFFLDWVNP
ncbi:hypothetical protein SLEP1_g18932 [Rubroshorea leprosula]|uniref:Uncharacterized protein n=1 Tax=Rubroshorea leprosula TaxID=152421 RepID=A0AAV5J8C4_9ROSI|nr:hypothetical protein SLEP1_g18932 [Rubroshorea leprosula]